MLDPQTPKHGFAALVGYRLVDWQEDRAEIALDVEARHLNRSGIAHGGVAATLLDTVLGYAGCHCAVPGRVRRAVTLSLTVNYIGAVEAGTTLVAVGRRVGGGRRVFYAEGEVRGPDGALVATGSGVWRYRDGSGSPEGVPAE
jgi:uncharacterized protein (TIGR00369 family)